MIQEEQSQDTKFAFHYLGPDARPTGQMRMLGSAGFGRLQCLWVSNLGSLWIDVPTVEVDVMPPRQFEP